MRATRYHSLIVEESTLPKTLRITARTEEGLPMALEHVSWPVYGVQFHPESILTEEGHRLLANFLHVARIPFQELPAGDAPGTRHGSPEVDDVWWTTRRSMAVKRLTQALRFHREVIHETRSSSAHACRPCAGAAVMLSSVGFVWAAPPEVTSGVAKSADRLRLIVETAPVVTPDSRQSSSGISVRHDRYVEHHRHAARGPRGRAHLKYQQNRTGMFVDQGSTYPICHHDQPQSICGLGDAGCHFGRRCPYKTD